MAIKELKLIDVLEFLPKSRRKAGDGLVSGQFPFFTSSQSQAKWFDIADYSKESLILGTGGSPSVHCAINFSTSTDVFILAPKLNDVSLKYVYYHLLSNPGILERGFKGAGLKHLSRDYVNKIAIPFPMDGAGNLDLGEQNRIVFILEEAEQLKNKRAEADTKTAELIPALFFKMFGDPSSSSSKYELVVLGDYCELITKGTTPATLKETYSNSGIRFVRSQNVQNNFLDWGEVMYISTSLHGGQLRRSKIKMGDVLLNIVGASIGRSCVYDLEEEANTNQAVAILRTKKDKICPEYLSNFLLLPSIQQIFSVFKKGGARDNLNLGQLSNLKISLPPIELQYKFAEIVKEIEVQKEKQKQSALHLNALFSSILFQEYISNQ